MPSGKNIIQFYGYKQTEESLVLRICKYANFLHDADSTYTTYRGNLMF